MTRAHTIEVLGQADIARALTRIGFEILESAKGAQDLVILGIHNRGVPLARRLAAALIDSHPEAGPIENLVGSLDITMYRDDLGSRPMQGVQATELPRGGLDDKIVVLVDDVLYSGRTIRAALDAIRALGRPRAVRLAVLVDRGHRELPIRADFVGKNLPTSREERVHVRLSEVDGVDCVVLDRTA